MQHQQVMWHNHTPTLHSLHLTRPVTNPVLLTIRADVTQHTPTLHKSTFNPARHNPSTAHNTCWCDTITHQHYTQSTFNPARHNPSAAHSTCWCDTITHQHYTQSAFNPARHNPSTAHNKCCDTITHQHYTQSAFNPARHNPSAAHNTCWYQNVNYIYLLCIWVRVRSWTHFPSLRTDTFHFPVYQFVTVPGSRICVMLCLCAVWYQRSVRRPTATLCCSNLHNTATAAVATCTTQLQLL